MSYVRTTIFTNKLMNDKNIKLPNRNSFNQPITWEEVGAFRYVSTNYLPRINNTSNHEADVLQQQKTTEMRRSL